MKQVANGFGCLALVFGISVAIVLPGRAAETMAHHFVDEHISYSTCYSVADPYFPGPAARFGEDVCVEYDGIGSELTEITTAADGSKDVTWRLTQRGTARVYAQSNQALLHTGEFELEEVAEDLGNDAGCLSAAAEPDVAMHASMSRCTDFENALDGLSHFIGFSDETGFAYVLSINEVGGWCYSDTLGQYLGPKCDGPPEITSE